jgi:hypothetical protein
MPAGTRIHCTAWFDNSEENLANPDPKARVRWGDQTWEEMMIGYFDMALADQDLSKPAAKRADEFLAKYNAGAKELNKKLVDLADKATESDAQFRALGLAMRDQFPQLDRMCLTTITGETMEVKYVLQEPRLRLLIGGAGIKVGTKGTAIAAAAGGDTPVMHPDLDKAKGTELQLMARGVASSLHIPVKIGDKSATINFWSTDKNAFPPEAVKLLEELGKKMVE